MSPFEKNCLTHAADSRYLKVKIHPKLLISQPKFFSYPYLTVLFDLFASALCFAVCCIEYFFSSAIISLNNGMEFLSHLDITLKPPKCRQQLLCLQILKKCFIQAISY